MYCLVLLKFFCIALYFYIYFIPEDEREEVKHTHKNPMLATMLEPMCLGSAKFEPWRVRIMPRHFPLFLYVLMFSNFLFILKL